MIYFIREYWKIIVGLVSIFIGGLGFGAVLESLRHRDAPLPQPETRQTGDWIESTIDSLANSLELTDTQKAEIRPQVEATAREIQLSRESALLKFEISLLELHRTIAPKLDPEQREALLKSQESLEKRIRRRSQDVLGDFSNEGEE